VIREWIGDGVDDASAGAAIELVGVRGRQALAIKGEGSSTR
jgi:hypothetical protein